MPCIQQLNKDIGEDAAFKFVFEGTEFLKNLTDGLDPKECEYTYILYIVFRQISTFLKDSVVIVFEQKFIRNLKRNDILCKFLNILAPHLFRECCWMVEKRGFVGESCFHICYLMQTPTHLFLGRRLLKHFPKLINDIYLSEEYYGENVLHMSCVAEDPTMVKWLLDQGVGMEIF